LPIFVVVVLTISTSIFVIPLNQFGIAQTQQPQWIIPNQVPDVPEFLVEGKEREYLSWFYQNEAYSSAAISQADIEEYTSHYSTPGGMHAGFEYYRAIPKDTIQNLNYSNTKITMPVLELGAGYHKYEGNVTTPLTIYGMRQVASNVTGITVHFQDQLLKFLGKLQMNLIDVINGI